MGKLIADISHHKKVQSWDKFLDSVPFAITKATEGRTFVDPLLKEFVMQCERHKKPYWLYTFMRNGTELSGTKFMVETCKELVGPYFMGYCLDVETGNDKKIPTVKGVQQSIDYLNSLGGKFLLYTMYAQYSIYKDVIKKRPANCAWWEARYGANNGKDTSNKYPCHNGVDLHQYTSKGTVPGIYPASAIDLNRITGQGKDLDWFCKTKKATTTASKDTYMKVVTEKDRLMLRKEPSSNSKILAKMPNGVKVKLIKKGTSWHKVDYAGTVGYAYAKYLKDSCKK